jgi:hypothetical protein
MPCMAMANPSVMSERPLCSTAAVCELNRYPSIGIQPQGPNEHKSAPLLLCRVTRLRQSCGLAGRLEAQRKG